MSRKLHDAVRVLAVSTVRMVLLVLALMWVSSAAFAHAGHSGADRAPRASSMTQAAFFPTAGVTADRQTVCRLVTGYHADGTASLHDVSFADLRNCVHTASASSCCGVGCHGAFHDVIFAVRAPSLKSQRIVFAEPRHSWLRVRYGLIRPPNA